MSTHVTQRSTTTPHTTSKAAPAARASALKVQLRKADFDAGAALLTPEGEPASPDDTYGLTEDDIAKRIANTQEHASAIEAACKVFGLDATMMRAKIAVESSGKPKEFNPSGASGLMQIKSGTWNEVIAHDGTKLPKIAADQPDWSGWTYTNANVQDAHKNAYVGCAVWVLKARDLTNKSADNAYPATKADGVAMPPFDANHPDYRDLTSLAYNLGQSTVAAAMASAKSTMLDDVLKKDPLDVAIREHLWGGLESKKPQYADMTAVDKKVAENAYVANKISEATNYIGRNRVMRERFEKFDAEQAKLGTGKTHQVVSGNTLFGVARMYGVTVDALREANALTDDTLVIGASLKIPGQANAAGETKTSEGDVDIAPPQPAAVAVTGSYRSWRLSADAAADESLAPAVLELTTILAGMGYGIAPTPSYGRDVAATVKSFQADARLPQTGVADRATWCVLLYRHHGAKDATLLLGDPVPLSLSVQMEVCGYVTSAETLDQATLDQLNAFRARFGLEPSDHVGQVTWALLHYHR